MARTPMSTRDDQSRDRHTGRPRGGRWIHAGVAAWIDAIMADPALGASSKCVGFAIGRFADGRSGLCWPSRTTLAKALAADDLDQIRIWLKPLVAAGYLTLRPGSGRVSSHYQLERGFSPNLIDQPPHFAGGQPPPSSGALTEIEPPARSQAPPQQDRGLSPPK
ncbi:helix-turn-helix domain-containing protein [Phreatobacter aquaticus]